MADFDKTDDPRRRLLISGLAAGVFAGIVPENRALAESIFGSQPGKLPPGQSIYRLYGDVTVNGQQATMSTRITANDTIRTGKNSEIVFVVGGNSMILRAESHITLQGEKKNDEPSFLISALRVLTGKILSVSRNKGMGIRTPTATIGIRGTGVYIEADPELTYFCTCYGLTDIVSNDDPSSKDTVAATHHDKPLYITSNAKQSGNNIRRAGFINHTDQELMLIETLVGRTPPFVFPGDSYDTPRRGY
jgi:hypothetical protein